MVILSATHKSCDGVCLPQLNSQAIHKKMPRVTETKNIEILHIEHIVL